MDYLSGSMVNLWLSGNCHGKPLPLKTIAALIFVVRRLIIGLED
jgi:hypothetical protein